MSDQKIPKDGLVEVCLPLRGQDGPDAQQEVCINGRWTIIKRGQKVRVAKNVFEVLCQAGMVRP